METTDYGTQTTSLDPAVAALITIVLIVICIALAFVFIYVANRKRKLHLQGNIEKKAIKVCLPKNRNEEKKDPKELIGAMENLYSTLHYFYVHKYLKRFWYGQPTFTFEITAQKGEIFFYVVVPTEYLSQIERHIHSQYPEAHLEVVDDYDIFLENDGIPAVATLELGQKEIFPIKTYKLMDIDPLSAITNSLSKVGAGRAAIQILVQPTNQGWTRTSEKALQNIQQGKHYNAGIEDGIIEKLLSMLKDLGKLLLNKSNEDENNDASNTSKANVRLTAIQEQQTKSLAEKAGKVGLKVQVRCLSVFPSEIESKDQAQTMLSAFSQYNSPDLNGFKVCKKDQKDLTIDYIMRTFSKKQATFVLNTEELTSICHFPNQILDTPNINWLGSKKLAPPVNLPKTGLKLGFSSYRGMEVPINMNYSDRSKHFYMIGKTGLGKTNMFQNMIIQDIRNGHGVCYMDPNGDAVEWILRHVPKERAEDVIIFNPADVGRPVGMNLLEFDPKYPEQKTMVINEVISIFDKLYDLKATGGPIFEQYMRNAMLLVMDDPQSGSTLMEIPKVLADAEFRKMKLSRCSNQLVKDFWINEAEKAGGEAALANMVPYITSKLTQFTSNDIMRPIIGQQTSAFNFRDAMDSRKIVLVTLSKGLLGDMNAMLLGMIISGKIQLAAFSRQNIAENQRVPFYFYVDEFQNFTSKTFATILSEARKYALALNITNQYIDQLDEDTCSAVMGNVGTMLAWRIGSKDAEFLKSEFDPVSVDDMVNTDKYNFYIRLNIDGATSRPFNAAAYPPEGGDNEQIALAVKQLSRIKYGRDRDLIEEEIRQRAKSML